MATWRFAALKIHQHGNTMYLASMAARDILALSQTDIWNADLPNDDPEDYVEKQGYQRQPMPRHYIKAASYISKSDSILPTSILLSSRGRLTFIGEKSNENVGSLMIKEEDLPLWIVDGQHRLRGIEHAIEEKGKTELEDFPLAVCIIDDVDKSTDVYQFHIINSTAKGIRTDLADRLLLLMEQMRPSSVKGSISASNLWRLRATQLTVLMNEQSSSCWEGRIRAPNTSKGRAVISERSFSTSLKPILTDGTMSTYPDEQLATWLTAFWNTVADLMPDAFQSPEEYAVQKTPGVYTFHMIAPRIFSLWLTGGAKGREAIARILTANNQIAEYFTLADYWRSGSGEGAGTTGMSGFTRLANDISEVLPEAELPDIGPIV